MPKVLRYDPETKARRAALRKEYGGFMTLADVARELGCKSRQTAAKAVAELPTYKLTGNTNRYDVGDVAALIERSRTAARGTI